MLTNEHVIVAFEKGKAIPDRLTRKAHAHYLAYAESMLIVYREGIGQMRRELHRRVERIFDEEPDCEPRRIHAFCKLLDDESDFKTDRKGESGRLRLAVFSLAAERHPLVASKIRLFESEETTVKQEIAGKLDKPWEAIDAALYADVMDFHRLKAFHGYPDAASLLSRYNVAQVQACLYRAGRMWVEAEEDFKTILRIARLVGLLHDIRRLGPSRYLIRFDGPASVLRHTRRYGVNMARFLPGLLACKGWKMRCEIQSPRGRPALLELSPADGLKSHLPAPEEFDSSVEESFARRFAGISSDWTLIREGTILHHGQKVFVPDFVFRRQDGSEVLMEIVGFWTPEYLREKLRTLRYFSRHRIIIAVDEALGDGLAGIEGPIIRYKNSLAAAPVVEALEGLRLQSENLNNKR